MIAMCGRCHEERPVQATEAGDLVCVDADRCGRDRERYLLSLRGRAELVDPNLRADIEASVRRRYERMGEEKAVAGSGGEQ